MHLAIPFLSRQFGSFLRLGMAWALLILMLFQGVAASKTSQWILCVGEDGHFSVESGHEGHCGPGNEEAQELADHIGSSLGDADSFDADHCGPCWDVAWDSLAPCLRGSSLQENSLHLPIGYRPAFDFELIRKTERDNALSPTQIPPSLTQQKISLQSIRLLI
jgi:hypothetical protein